MPEGGFAGGEERVLAGVPAQEMWRAGVGGVMVAGFPDFVEQECAGLVGTTMKVELQAALFLAGGRDEGAQFRFEEQVLAFLRAHDHDQGDRVLGEFRDRGAPGPAASRALCRSAGLGFGHDGGDFTPNERKRK